MTFGGNESGGGIELLASLVVEFGRRKLSPERKTELKLGRDVGLFQNGCESFRISVVIALAIAISNDSSSGQMGDGLLLAAGECGTTSVVGVSSVSISSWGICGLCIISPNTSAGSTVCGNVWMGLGVKYFELSKEPVLSNSLEDCTISS